VGGFALAAPGAGAEVARAPLGLLAASVGCFAASGVGSGLLAFAAPDVGVFFESLAISGGVLRGESDER
jgi:hypothetical protein